MKLTPQTRVRGAWILLVVTTLAGAASTVLLASSGYERVLMAISWGAISITCIDILATTDVRANEPEESP